MQKESKTLKVTSIIMIIGGILGAIISILGLAGGQVLQLGAEELSDDLAALGGSALGQILTLISVVMLVGALIQLLAGVIGVKKWDKPGETTLCLVLGGIVITISVISSLFSFVSSGFTLNSVISLLLGLVIPVLYTYSALQLNRSQLGK